MVRSAWQRLTGASPRAVLAAAWLVLVIVGYPGRLPVASIDLLRHAHAPHPSAAALVWHLVEYVVAGPTGLIVAQATLAVAGAYALLGGTRDPAGAAWRTLAFVVLPPVLATLTIVSAPTLAACLLLAGAGWLVAGRLRAAAVALALAGAVGSGLVVAAVAIALLAGRAALRPRLVIAVVVAVLGIAGNLALPHARPHAPAAAMLAPASTIDPPTAPASVLLPLGIPTERSHVQDVVVGALDLVPALAAPALALVLVLAFAFVRRRDRTLLALAAAALLAEAAALVLAPDADVYQSAALLALAAVIALRREPA